MGHVPLVVSPESVCTCRASCWQPGISLPTSPGVSEDCLYLNVFVPQSVVSSEALAVSAPLAAPVPTAASTFTHPHSGYAPPAAC